MIFLAHPYGCYSIGIDTRKGVCGQALAGGSGCPQFVKIWSIRTHSDCSDDFLFTPLFNFFPIIKQKQNLNNEGYRQSDEPRQPQVKDIRF